MDTKQQILQAFEFRHACKEFDPNKKIPDEDFNFILETGRLSPSSFGLEPWKFLILQNSELREKIKPFCWGGRGQLPTASHFIIILARSGKDMRAHSDHLQKYMAEVQQNTPEMAKGRMERLCVFQEQEFDLLDDRALFDWACKQTYITLGNMLTAAAQIGIDSCPMEGFNREKLEKVLMEENILDKEHFGVSVMAAFGYRKNPSRPKMRQSLDKIVGWIK